MTALRSVSISVHPDVHGTPQELVLAATEQGEAPRYLRFNVQTTEGRESALAEASISFFATLGLI